MTSPRHDAVLDVAERVFSERGLRGVTVGQLAAEARCSRRTLYEIAPSKEGLLVAVLDRMMRRVAQQAAAAAAAEDDPARRVVAFLRGGLPVLRPFSPPLAAAIEDEPGAQAVFAEHLAAARTTLGGLIEAAIAAGRFRPIDVAVAVEGILGAVRALMEPGFLADGDRRAPDALEAWIAMLVEGVAAERA